MTVRIIKALLRQYDAVSQIPFRLVGLRRRPYAVLCHRHAASRFRLIVTSLLLAFKVFQLTWFSFVSISSLTTRLVCRNYALMYVDALCFHLVHWYSSRDVTSVATHKATLYSSVSRVATSAKRLKAVTCLYGDEQRITFWRRVTLARYAAFNLSVLAAFCLTALNMYFTRMMESNWTTLQIVSLLNDSFVGINTAFFGVHFLIHFTLQIFLYADRMQLVRLHLLSIMKRSESDQKSGSINAAIVIHRAVSSHLTDWNVLKGEFQRESRVFSILVALIIFPIGQQTVSWMYYVFNVISNDATRLLAGVGIITSCMLSMTGMTLTGSMIDHHRINWIKTLHSVLYLIHLLTKHSKVRLTRLQKRLISEVTRDEPLVTHWAVKCWPTGLKLCYTGSLRIIIELIIFYLLMTRSVFYSAN